MTEPISKDMLTNWLKSTLLFAQTVRSTMIQELDEEQPVEKVDPYEYFWDSLRDFSIKYLEDKIMKGKIT